MKKNNIYSILQIHFIIPHINFIEYTNTQGGVQFMQVNAVSNYYTNNKYNNTPSFKSLIIEKSASNIIKQLSKEDTLELQEIKKRLSKTKFWDMKISSVRNKFEELKFHFIGKKNDNDIITDGIYPYNIYGKDIKFYTIIYGPESSSLNAVDTLKFDSGKRAEELYDTYKQNIQYMINRNYNLRPIESIKMKEVELQMLEESAQHTYRLHDKGLVNTEIKTKSTIGNGFVFIKNDK